MTEAELAAREKALAESQDRLAKALNGSRNSWEATTSSSSALGTIFGKLGSGITNLADGIKTAASSAQELKNSWQEASRMGLGLGKDMFTFQSKLLEAGLTFEEYKKATQSLTTGVSGLASGMNAGMKQYLASVQEFKGSALGDIARRFGTDFEEMAELTALSTDRRLKQDKILADGNTALTQRTFDLSLAVASNTEVFGISRTAQMEALKKNQEDALLQQQMTGKQKEQYDKMFTSLEALGLGKFGNLAVKQQGRFTSDQQVEMMASMGAGNAREFQDAIKESLKASEFGPNSPEVKAANERMARVQENIINYSQSEAVKNRASMSVFMDGSLKTGFEKSADIAYRSAGIYERMSRENIGLEEAIRRTNEELKARPAAAKTPGKEGELATDAVLKIERAVRDTGAVVGLAITTGAQKTGEVLAGALKPHYDKFANNNLRDKSNAFSSSRDGLSPDIVRKLLVEIKDGTISSVGDVIYKEFVRAVDYLKGILPGRETGSPGINSFLSGSGFGNLSSIFEDFGSGTTAVLHGNEAVFRPEQLAGVIGKVQSSTQGLLSNVQNQFTPEKITNLINTAVASATSNLPNVASGINSATNGQVQLNNSTLEEIKGQMITLNTIMDSHLRNISSTADKQYSALKSLSPDLHS